MTTTLACAVADCVANVDDERRTPARAALALRPSRSRG